MQAAPYNKAKSLFASVTQKSDGGLERQGRIKSSHDTAARELMAEEMVDKEPEKIPAMKRPITPG
jgi:hypothetical protein